VSGPLAAAQIQNPSEELRRRINGAVPAADIPPGAALPNFQLSALLDMHTLQCFLVTMDWALDEARRANEAP
jgi:hypothetical protein